MRGFNRGLGVSGDSCTTLSSIVRILLANLSPRDTAAIAALDSPDSCAFNNGICEAQFSALGGSPTLSLGFSTYPKCLSNKDVLSGIQNFVIAIGKPVGLNIEKLS
jgi:hypothetical protein